MDEIRREMIVQKAGMNANDRFIDKETLRKALKEAGERYKDVSFMVEIGKSENSEEGFAKILASINQKRLDDIYKCQVQFDQKMAEFYKDLIEHPEEFHMQASIINGYLETSLVKSDKEE